MFDEEAKAVQEVAKTTGKGIEAASKGLGFIATIIQEPLQVASGIWTDKLKYTRWERQVALQEKVNSKMAQLGMPAPTRHIPLKIAIPILQEGSMEEDDYLQDRWATLLVNAANADSSVEVRSTFISMLRDMSALDVQNLNEIYSWDFEEFNALGVLMRGLNAVGVLTHELPFKSRPAEPEEVRKKVPDEIAVSLNNLARLRCIRFPLTLGREDSNYQVFQTLFGRTFIEACSMSTLPREQRKYTRVHMDKSDEHMI